MPDLGGGAVVVITAPEQPIITVEAPANPSIVVVPVAGPRGPAGTGTIESLVAGENVTIDDTDPAHPVISSDGGGDVESVNDQVGVVWLTADDIPDGVAARQYTAVEQTKLEFIEPQATKNSTDAELRDRSTHTGEQAIATITGLVAALAAKAATGDLDTETAARLAADLLLIPLTQKGAAGGVVPLDGAGLIPTSFLPALAITNTFVVDDEAEMLALDVQTGDVAVRLDVSESFILQGADPTVLGDWQILLSPTDAVSSVDGRQGAVSLTDLYDAIGAGAAAQAYAIQRSNHTGTQPASTISDFATAVAALITGKENTITVGTTAQYWRGDKTFVTLDQDAVPDGPTNKQYSGADKTKLAGIASGATANSSDAYLLARANHTGTESADVLTDGTTNKAYLALERLKLNGIQAGATQGDQLTVLAVGNFSGAMSFSASGMCVFTLTATGDLSAPLSGMPSPTKGGSFVLEVTQDSTGGKKLTNDAAILYVGALPILDPRPGALTRLRYFYNGSVWTCTQQQDVATNQRMANPALKSIASVVGGTATPSVLGMVVVATSTSGNATAPTMAATNLHTSTPRSDLAITVAAPNAIAGWRVTTGGPRWRGNAAGLGGFKAQFRFGPAAGQNGAGRMFTGLAADTATPTNVQASALIDCIGVGWDDADTQLYIISNDASGTATKTATGLTRSTTDRSKVYTLTIQCAPNASSMDVAIVDEVAGTTFSTTLSSDLPTNTAFLYPRSWCSTVTSSQVGIALMGYYSES